jgi:hypothetical protein
MPWPRPASSIRSRRTTKERLALGLPAGLAAGLGCAILAGLGAGLLAGVGAGLAGWLAFGLLFGIKGELWSPDADLGAPYDGLRYELLSGLAGGLVCGLALGLAFGLGFGFVAGLTAGTALGFLFGLALADVWIRYAVGVTCAAVRQRLPLRLKNFMKRGAAIAAYCG